MWRSGAKCDSNCKEHNKRIPQGSGAEVNSCTWCLRMVYFAKGTMHRRSLEIPTAPSRFQPPWRGRPHTLHTLSPILSQYSSTSISSSCARPTANTGTSTLPPWLTHLCTCAAKRVSEVVGDNCVTNHMSIGAVLGQHETTCLPLSSHPSPLPPPPPPPPPPTHRLQEVQLPGPSALPDCGCIR